MRRKKKSRLAAAEFLAVLIVTAVVFAKGLSAALAWRGYRLHFGITRRRANV